MHTKRVKDKPKDSIKTNRQSQQHVERQETDRETNRQTDRQTDRQKDRQTDRQKDEQTDRRTNRQTDRRTKTGKQVLFCSVEKTFENDFGCFHTDLRLTYLSKLSKHYPRKHVVG